MSRDSRYDILFEPVSIGPVTAPNRFYQVPHASGMTNAMPRVRAGFREAKAEGGWGVICTGACSIHPSSDDSPLPYARLWDRNDIRSHAMMTEAVHRHGSLAGVELWHGGAVAMNRTSRIPPLSPSGTPWMATHVGFMSNLRPRIMDRADIRELIDWQKEGARKAREAGFDILYVYAGMGYLPYQFLLPEYNQRTDEYGGPLANRARLIAELLDATREAARGECAVALRISLEELRQRNSESLASEAHETIALLSDHVDLFDVKMDSSPTDCGASRFTPEGSHEPVIDFVKSVTGKPVVGVGRFTSPDTMVSQVKRGVLDLIGGARPSIADPFLPRKIDEGREDEIRECIGCNICIANWHDGVPVRCTQNPTVGEEWRRNWHPERIEQSLSPANVLIAGSGPAGLECALSLGRRGHSVTLAEACAEFGGRLRFETTLPGLTQWGRVLEYRLGRLQRMANVDMFVESEVSADQILEFGFEHVVLATGSRWTRELYSPMEVPAGRIDGARVYTPDDIANGAVPEPPIVVFDFDNYVMGGAIAELLAERHGATSYITPAGHASAWTILSNELPQVYQALAAKGVPIYTTTIVKELVGDTLQLADLFTGAVSTMRCGSLVIVGGRRPHDRLHHELAARSGEVASAGIRSIVRIGDASAPGAVVHAVYSGHQYAREFGETDAGGGLPRIDAPITTVEPLPDSI